MKLTQLQWRELADSATVQSFLRGQLQDRLEAIAEWSSETPEWQANVVEQARRAQVIRELIDLIALEAAAAKPKKR